MKKLVISGIVCLILFGGFYYYKKTTTNVYVYNDEVEKAEKEAKETVALEVTKARTDAAKLIEQTNRELEAQKSLALQKLETQVDELSQLIKEKLLGKEVVL